MRDERAREKRSGGGGGGSKHKSTPSQCNAGGDATRACARRRRRRRHRRRRRRLVVVVVVCRDQNADSLTFCGGARSQMRSGSPAQADARALVILLVFFLRSGRASNFYKRARALSVRGGRPLERRRRSLAIKPQAAAAAANARNPNFSSANVRDFCLHSTSFFSFFALV